MNNTFGFPTIPFYQSPSIPFAYQYAHSTTNIYWCHPELFCNVVYPNSQIFLNNSTNSIVVTQPLDAPPHQEEKPKREEKKKETKEQKILGRKKEGSQKCVRPVHINTQCTTLKTCAPTATMPRGGAKNPGIATM